MTEELKIEKNVPIDGPVIEKGVPIPRRVSKRYLAMIELFKKMEIGDSVLIKDKSINTVRVAARLTFEPKHSTAREVEGGVRLWRVK